MVRLFKKNNGYKKSIKNNILNQAKQNKRELRARRSPHGRLGINGSNFLICNQKYYKFLRMAQQQKRKQYESESDSNSQSEQEQKEDEDQMDSFIAADDQQVQDDYIPRRYDDDDEDSGQRKKSKKLRKKQKRRLKRQRQQESELDEGDLDVLEQEELQGGRLNRLKKKTQIKKKDYSDEEDDDEDMNDFEEKDDEDLSGSVGGLRQESEEDSGLNEAFEDDGGDIFQPEDDKRFFQEQQDKEIIALDVPQRYYYQLRNYAKSHNKSIQETIKLFQMQDRNAEAKWIYAKGKFFNGDQRQIKQKIRLVLQMMHREKIEIMYIYYYRRKVYGDLLSRDDLWKIYKLDQEWFTFKEQFSQLRDNLMNVIYSFQEMPRLENMIQQTVDIEKLKYFKDFENFKLLERKPGKKRNIDNEVITQIRGKGLDQWLRKSEAFLSPQNLCHNLINRSHDKKARNPVCDPREQLQRVIPSNNPQNDKIMFPLLTHEKRVATLCQYLELELFTHPELRKQLKEQYFKHLMISTTPTLKGQQDINIYSEYFPVKKIRNKPIQTLNRQLWILAQEAERKDFITIDLKFQWGKAGIQNGNFEGDKVYDRIMKFYYEISVHREGQNWNIFRQKVISKMLHELFLPAFFKEVKEELTKEGEEVIINAACDAFKKKLLIPPKNYRILAMMLEDKKLGIVYVGQNGVEHSPLQITLVNDEQLKRFANDEIIKKYIEDFKPELICVGANSRRAQTLRKAIRQNQDLPFCSLCPSEIPSLVAKQRKLEGSTEEITVLEAASMARFQRNPLVETLAIWNSNIQQNGVLSMNLHPFQSFVNQRKLKDALEMVAIEAVNLIGIDINHLVDSKEDSTRKILQFVCGFGPRKAFDFYQKNHGQTILNRRELEDLTSGKVVFKNCAPFFKIQTHHHKALMDKSDKQKKKDKNDTVNLLDTTRIPPEWYETTEELILKAIKNLSIDMRQRKIYTNCSEKTIAELQMFRDPSKVNSIEWIYKREESAFYDERLVKQEFNSRFRMPNEPRYQFNQEELFYSLLRQTKNTLKKYMIVTVKILSVNERFLNVVIPQNGLFGSIKIFDKKPEYQKGNFIKAVITGFPFQQSELRPRNDDKELELLKVDMGLSFPHKIEDKSQDHNCFEICFKTIIKELHPLIDLEKDRFDLKKEDRPVIEVRDDGLGRAMKTEFRKISHRKFKNLPVGPALQLIKNSPIGDFVIRPSSDGLQYLNITWHFFSGVIAHLKLKSEQRNISTSAPVYRIISDKDNKVYESLDKVIDEYITPMNSLVQDVTSNRKFLPEPVEKIQEKARQEMGKQPSLIHYFFGCSPEFPQYFLLIYMYRDKKPIKQLIKVRSTGLYFHDQVFNNIRELIGWFKNHCKDKEYQAYVKKYSIKK